MATFNISEILKQVQMGVKKKIDVISLLLFDFRCKHIITHLNILQNEKKYFQ